MTTNSFANSVSTTLGWSNLARLTSILTQKTGNAALLDLGYSYYANGQIQQITNNSDGLKTEKYSYDDLGRLFTAQRGPDNNIQRKYSYDYDRFGNRWAQTLTAGTQGYGGQNSFNYPDNRVTTSGFSYDNSGNISANGPGSSFTYNQENFLTAASTTLGAPTYTVDTAGRRTKKTVSGISTNYFYSGSQVISEKQNSTWTEYIFFGDQRIAKQTGSTSATATYLHSDHLGSTRRWMAVDPLPGSPDDPQSVNRYGYVLDDPVNLVDPSGLQCEWVLEWQLVDVIHEGPNGQPYPSLEFRQVRVRHCESAPQRLGPGGGGGGGGGRGANRSGPTMGPAPYRLPGKCRIVDPVLGALELTFKAGPEGQLGPLKLGASLYKNLSTGDTGGTADVNVGLVSLQVDNPTPQGGNLGGTTEGNQVKFSFLGFQKNLTTGEPWSFSPSKSSLRFGLQLGVGFEIGFNSDKFNELSRQNAACRAQGGS